MGCVYPRSRPRLRVSRLERGPWGRGRGTVSIPSAVPLAEIRVTWRRNIPDFPVSSGAWEVAGVWMGVLNRDFCVQQSQSYSHQLFSAGTHFRYGTIWWDMDGPSGILATGINIDIEVTFYMQLAFRRDYTWGAYFNEQWRSSDTATWENGPTGQTISCTTPGIECFGGTQASIVDNYQIKFPNGQGTNGVALIPNGAPKICYSPLHKGVRGDWSWDPDTDGDCQDQGGYLPPTTPGVTELRCPSEEYEPAYMKTVAPQDPANPSAAVVATDTMEASVCTPWHELVGFYFGDDTYGFPDVDNDPNTQDGPILTVGGH